MKEKELKEMGEDFVNFFVHDKQLRVYKLFNVFLFYFLISSLETLFSYLGIVISSEKT